jgi:hypothetical protein
MTGAANMSDSLRLLFLFVGFIALSFVLNKWVLPRLGVKT